MADPSLIEIRERRWPARRMRRCAPIRFGARFVGDAAVSCSSS
jgi:hypothetical protein